MSIGTPTNLITPTGSGTDNTVYTTASMSPAANVLLLLYVSNAAALAADCVVPTIAGTLGLTWTQVDTGTTLNADLRGTLFWAKTTSSPPTGNVSMTFSATQSSCEWQLAQITNANLSAPIEQFGQFQTATTDNPGVTLPVAIGSGNATFGFSTWNTTTALPVGTGYTQLSASPSFTSPSIISSVEYKVAGATVVDWTTTSNVQKILFGVEIAAATAQTLPTATEAETSRPLGRKKTLTMNGAMNWLDNIGAETDVVPWTSNNHLGARDLATVTRDTARAHSGVASIKAVWPSSSLGSDTYQGNDPATPLGKALHVGKSYTFSCWVYVPAGSPNVQPAFALLSGGASMTTKDAWVFVTWTDVMPTNHVAVGIQTVGTPITGGTMAYTDDHVFTEAGATPPVDTAQPFAREKTKALPTAVQTNTAQALPRVKHRVLTATTQTDTAQALTRGRLIVSYAPTELELAQQLTRVRGRLLPPATATNTGQTLARIKRTPVPVAAEVEEGQYLDGPFPQFLDLPVANDTSTAVALGSARATPLPVATEHDLSIQPLGGFSTVEVDQAQVFTRRKRRNMPLPVSGTNTALGFSRRHIRILPVAVEIETAPLSPARKKRPLPVATHTVSARPFGVSAPLAEGWFVSNGTVWVAHDAFIAWNGVWVPVEVHLSNGLSWA